MIYDGSEYSEEALYKELEKRVELENVTDFEAFSELVDEIIEEKKRYGFYSDEEDLEQVKQHLKLRWREIASPQE